MAEPHSQLPVGGMVSPTVLEEVDATLETFACDAEEAEGHLLLPNTT